MKHGTYIGSIEHLKGKTALLRDDFGPTIILAQFDDTSLTCDSVMLGWGWHQFHPWEFELDEKEES